MTIALRQRPLARVVAGIVRANDGALFDPSDLSTLYQDAAGMIPVTAVEQPVGKMLDKSGNGYHATQSITASRPTLSARYNLLTSTEDFSDAAWAVYAQGKGSTPIKTNNYGIAPDGSHTAGRIQLSLNGGGTNSDRSDIYVGVSTVAGNDYSIAVWFKTTDNTTKTIALNFNFTGGGNIIVTGVWQKFTVSLSSAIDTYRFMRFGLRGGYGTSDFADILVWHPQQVVGTSISQYQRVNTSTDYNTDERYFPKYLRFDGIDDYLNLPYMGLYANGSASVVAGVYLQPKATTQYIIGETTSTASSSRYAPLVIFITPPLLTTLIRNDSNVDLINSANIATALPPPPSVTSVVDTGNRVSIRTNSVLVSTANYSRASTLTANITSIGALAQSTAVFFAQMNLYSLIITKSALTDAQRIKCERYAASKAGVIL